MFAGSTRVIAPAAVLAVLLGGCSSDDTGTPLPGGPDSSAAASPTAAASPNPTGVAVPATVVRLTPVRPLPATTPLLDGYQAFWIGLTDAYRTGRTAALAGATVDPARTRYLARAAALRQAAQTQRGTVLGRPVVADLAAGVIVDCMDLRDFRTFDRTGRAVFPRDAATTRVRATMRSVGGRWRLAQFETRGPGCRL